MNGEIVSIGLFGSSLRKQLFAEHLGLLDPMRAGSVDLTDPISDNFYNNVWVATSQTNTEIFEEVFHCLPSDRVTTFKEIQAYHEELPLVATDPAAATIKASEIRVRV